MVEREARGRQVAVVSPHQLRHGLAYSLVENGDAGGEQILGHSRVSTTLEYGQPMDADLRAALEEAGRIR